MDNFCASNFGLRFSATKSSFFSFFHSAIFFWGFYCHHCTAFLTKRNAFNVWPWRVWITWKNLSIKFLFFCNIKFIPLIKNLFCFLFVNTFCLLFRKQNARAFLQPLNRFFSEKVNGETALRVRNVNGSHIPGGTLSPE